jgi:hypothetical protein
MLNRLIKKFVDYCHLTNFSERSIQALSARLKDFSGYLKKGKNDPLKSQLLGYGGLRS